MKKYIYLIVIVFGSVIGAFAIIVLKNKDRSAPNDFDYLLAIAIQEDFDLLKGAPLSSEYSNVETIKIAYDIKQDLIYFINSTKYRYHYDFCKNVLSYFELPEVFNATNYSKSSLRQYYLANINYYKDLNVYTVEFVAEDKISSTQVLQLFHIIKDKTFFGDSIKLFINNNHLQSFDHSNLLNVPKIYPSDIYGNQQFQAVNEGSCYGYLRVIDNLNDQYNQVDKHDIIVIKGSPLSIPVCAGVLTNVFQTPMSHVNVLCHNRKIPSAAQINLFDLKSVIDFTDKLVKLVVTADGITIEAATETEANTFWLNQKIKSQILLTADIEWKELLPVALIKNKNKQTIGSKAYGFAQLYALQNNSDNSFYVPEGAFAIPFYYYHQHITHPAVSFELNKIFSDSIYLLNNDSMKVQLKRIRKAIMRAPLNAYLQLAVETEIQNNNLGKAYRFRSSSNAEDLAGFNGAGLYASKTGILNDSLKSISKAIKTVWASVWTLRAYQERNLYNINHSTVMMGILVHRNFQDEEANGVAITKNLYRKDFPGFTINVQKGEVSVVAPPEGVTCDQFICYESAEIEDLNNNIVSEYITHSSINNSVPVLNEMQITTLHNALDWVKEHFFNKGGFKSEKDFTEFGMDVEFKFDKNGKLYFKQARPYY